MLTTNDILLELELETDPTRRTLERVPEDKLDWRPHEKSFSLGQLAMHVATIPGALDDSLANARRIVGSMDDATLAAPWSMVMGDQVLITIPRVEFIRRILLNHWYHHRGQLSVYLRQTGALVPAIYGPSADEMPAFG